MKVYTMYLPQFHRTPENDVWWGEGFTEWTAVKGAREFFAEQQQPKVPQYENYYNLLDYNTMKWQAELMQKYGVDGQCFYHYWFKDGRRILEKPAENLLQWKDVGMPFCFYWANESWIRSWSNLNNGNIWMNEEQKDTDAPSVLLEQAYGDRDAWVEHFEYLLPFFKDERYIRIEDKPVFMLYKTKIIPVLTEMIDCWQNLAKEHGLKGIYFIGAETDEGSKKKVDAELIHEPKDTVGHCFSERYTYGTEKNICRALTYDAVWQQLLRKDSGEDSDKPIFYSGFVGYDDTPRRGKSGTSVYGATPEKFREYLTELMAKNAASGNEIVFLNAWNEWGEGMYLEPDETYGSEYLEGILYAKHHYKERVCRYTISDETRKWRMQNIDNLQKKAERYECHWRVEHKLLLLKERKLSLAEYLREKGILRVAIYGMGMIGKHVMEELGNSEVELRYGVDRSAEDIHLAIPVYQLSASLEEVDAVIISTVNIFEEVSEEIRELGVFANIISLENLLDECLSRGFEE